MRLWTVVHSVLSALMTALSVKLLLVDGDHRFDPNTLSQEVQEFIRRIDLETQFELLRQVVRISYESGYSTEDAATSAIDTVHRSAARMHSMSQPIPDYPAPVVELDEIYTTYIEDTCLQILPLFDRYQEQLEFIVSHQLESRDPVLRLNRIRSLCRRLIVPEVRRRVVEAVSRKNNYQQPRPRAGKSIHREEASSSSISPPADAAQASTSSRPDQAPHGVMTRAFKRELTPLINRIHGSRCRGLRSVADAILNGDDSIERSAAFAIGEQYPGETIASDAELDSKYREMFVDRCAEILPDYDRHEGRINSIISSGRTSMGPELQLLRTIAEVCRELYKEETLRALRGRYAGKSETATSSRR